MLSRKGQPDSLCIKSRGALDEVDTFRAALMDSIISISLHYRTCFTQGDTNTLALSQVIFKCRDRNLTLVYIDMVERTASELYNSFKTALQLRSGANFTNPAHLEKYFAD